MEVQYYSNSSLEYLCFKHAVKESNNGNDITTDIITDNSFSCSECNKEYQQRIKEEYGDEL